MAREWLARSRCCGIVSRLRTALECHFRALLPLALVGAQLEAGLYTSNNHCSATSKREIVMYIDRSAIEHFDKRYRAALINSITGYKPAVLVGSADSDGQSNLAIMSSLVHLGSHPPLLALVLRPDSVERHTLSNIRSLREYTLNHVAAEFVQAAHQTAASYPKEVSEFAATGLTEHWTDQCAAPFVAEANVKMQMTLREEHALAINGTHLVIGEVVGIDLPDAALRDDGSLALTAVDSVALSGLDSYFRPELLRRMAYAKPDSPPKEID